MKKFAFIALTIILLTTFRLYAQPKKVLSKEEVLENKILDTVLNLPEVKASEAYIKKKTKGKRHLGAVIYVKPNKDQPYYWVKVWEDNGYSYVSWYNFHVYTKPFGIKYLDTIHAKVFDLKTWRKKRKNGPIL